MVAKVQTLLKAVQGLSDREQLELISAIAQLLQGDEQPPSPNRDFWNPQSLAQILQTQRRPPFHNRSDWGGDFWPEEEKVEEIIGYLYAQRQEDLTREQ